MVSRKNIQDALLKKGIKPQLLGFQYLTDAIELVLSDESYKYNVHNLLYPEIASREISSVSRVERAIRHSITSAKLPYSNRHFIALVSLEVKK